MDTRIGCIIKRVYATMFFTVLFTRTNIGQQLAVKLWRFM